MNLLQLAQKVALFLDDDEITTVENTTEGYILRIVDAINEGYADCWNSLGINEYAEISGSINTTIGRNYVNLPDDVLNLTSLTCIVSTTRNDIITILPYKEFRLQAPSVLNRNYTGLPGFASVYGRKIYFDVIPMQVYAINYTANGLFTPLSEDDDEPVFAEQFQNALISYAKYKIYQYERDSAGAQMAYADYIKQKDQLISNHAQHNDLPPSMLPEGAFY